MSDSQVVAVSILPLEEGIRLPCYAHPGDAGMDVCANQEALIAPGAYALIGLGFAMALPKGYEAQMRPRSGLALKHGITVLNTPGTVDCGYRGEIKVVLINHGTAPFQVEKGMRIAQMVIAPVQQATIQVVTSLDDTQRGEGGYGSTGL